MGAGVGVGVGTDEGNVDGVDGVDEVVAVAVAGTEVVIEAGCRGWIGNETCSECSSRQNCSARDGGRGGMDEKGRCDRDGESDVS